MIEEGTFREDLYYRLNVVELALPPLRERRDDIISLTLFFLEEFNQKYSYRKRVSSLVMKQLRDYTWPGNVRELRNVVERMVVLSPGNNLEIPADLEMPDLKRKMDVLYEGKETMLPLGEYIDQKEKEYLLWVRARCRTTREMAKYLQVDHSTVIRKLKKYGISATR